MVKDKKFLSSLAEIESITYHKFKPIPMYLNLLQTIPKFIKKLKQSPPPYLKPIPRHNKKNNPRQIISHNYQNH